MTDISLTTIAIIILILAQGFESLTRLIFWAKGKTIKQNLFSVISPLITVYVLYGLITTASEAAVKTFVYIEGGMFVVVCVLSLVVFVCMASENK